MLPNVWIVNKRNHDYKDASKYGNLRALTSGKVNIFKTQSLIQEIKNTLDIYANENDYIVLAGYIVANIIAVHYFLINFGKVNILIWDASQNRYVKSTITEFMELDKLNTNILKY